MYGRGVNIHCDEAAGNKRKTRSVVGGGGWGKRWTPLV